MTLDRLDTGRPLRMPGTFFKRLNNGLARECSKMGLHDGEMTETTPSPRDALMQMITAYWLSQAVHVAAALGIADLLKDGPRSAEDLAGATGTNASALYRLLRALSGAGVFAEENGRFGLTPLGEYLRSDVAHSLGPYATYMGEMHLWTSWGHLLDSVRTGEPAFLQVFGTTPWEYRAARPEENKVFDAAMTSLSADVIDAVVRSYDFTGIGVLADVGGGEGAFLAAVLAANPNMRGILFDQPQVVASAGPLLERAGVDARCEIVGGSFFDAVPAGADAYLLKSVVHDWDDDSAVKILRRCRDASGKSGRVLLVEPVIRPGNDPDPAKFTDLNMLVMLGGQERTADDFERLYAAAGFTLTRIIPTGSGFYVIEGSPA